ncbi:MAG: PKD domain-containing protein [Solirubrobacteraceae bacterium]
MTVRPSWTGSCSARRTAAAKARARWVWNDGTPDGSGPTPTHAFATTGLRSVQLYITDSDGKTAAVGHGITVSAGV